MNTNHTRSTDARPNNPRGMASRTIKMTRNASILVLRGDVAGGKCLERSEQQSADDRSDGAADAAEHGRGETLERKQRSDVVARQRDGTDQDARHRADRRRNSKG